MNVLVVDQWRCDDAGRTSIELRAPLMRSDSETGIGTVEEPNIRIQQAGEEWYISAESAVIAADREVINLTGAVNVRRRNPSTGENLFYGEFLVNAQGEDVVAGIRTPKPVADMEGDAAHGCITLQVRYGVKKAAWMISPFSKKISPRPDWETIMSLLNFRRAEAGTPGGGIASLARDIAGRLQKILNREQSEP